ncbi:MAG: (2Fe-2S)-binding protein [Polyangiaceae bacterium]
MQRDLAPRRPPPAPLSVVAFVPGWTSTRFLSEQRRVRAELRALGADLVVVSESGAFRVSTDGAGPLPDARPEGLGPPEGSVGIYLVDDARRVRFEHVDASADPADAAENLARALGAATAAMRGPATACPARMTRREWTIASLAIGLGAVFLGGCGDRAPTEASSAAVESSTKPPSQPLVTLRVNGQVHTFQMDPRATLLDALRERLDLPGTKKGCDHGQCGACTVLVGGQRILSCLALAITMEEKEITTIEGLAHGEALHPMQQAFLDEDAFQCGYCTPGQILSAVGLLLEGAPRDDADIRERMCGNLCRCGAYENIVAAIRRAHGAAG